VPEDATIVAMSLNADANQSSCPIPSDMDRQQSNNTQKGYSPKDLMHQDKFNPFRLLPVLSALPYTSPDNIVQQTKSEGYTLNHPRAIKQSHNRLSRR
jgi:hypothetical protein